MVSIRLKAGSATDVGLVRSNNQDQFLMAEPVFAVADGMGGAAAGEVASSIAVRTLGDAVARRAGPLTQDLLVEAARSANRAVWQESIAHSEMRGMGTTLVAAALIDGDRLAVVNVGDSRLYSMRGDVFQQVTVDHNLVAELVAEGRISKEEGQVHPRRNIMTRALGVEPEVEVDVFVEAASPGDRFLLCSDGLPRELSDDRISAILRRLSEPSAAAKELVHEAKRHGGNDNITVVVLDVHEEDAAPHSFEAGDVEISGTAVTASGATPPTHDAALRADSATSTSDSFAAPAGLTATEPGSADESTKLLSVININSGGGTNAGPAYRPNQRKASVVTLRVAAFIAAFIVIVAAGAAGVWYYARSAYYVGIRGNALVVYQGRPGGVLWIEPTLNHVSSVTTGQVLQASLPSLHSGVEEPSVAAADSFIANLAALYQKSQTAALPPPTTPTTPPSTSTTSNAQSPTSTSPTTS